MSKIIKERILLSVVVLVLLGVFFVQPIAQDLRYHQFADQRTYVGIKNCWNVLSNIPFVLIALFGIYSLVSGLVAKQQVQIGWVFFVGLFLTGFGSAYYHLEPSNGSLVWDRLPMTISFMSLFAFVLSMHINHLLGQKLLWPLLLVGAVSVVYWFYTEGMGQGDLRFYGVVQFLPILLMPMMLLMFKSTTYKQSYVWWLIVIYIVAKLAEHFDGEVFALIGFSGHSIKHIVAALSGLAFLFAIQSVKPKAKMVGDV